MVSCLTTEGKTALLGGSMQAAAWDRQVIRQICQKKN